MATRYERVQRRLQESIDGLRADLRAAESRAVAAEAERDEARKALFQILEVGNPQAKAIARRVLDGEGPDAA